MGTMVGKSDRRTCALILLAQFCSLLGQEVLQFVLPLYLLDVTGSGTRFGLAIACGFVPYTLLSPIGGVLADRTRKRGIMMGVNAALVAVLLVFLALKDTGDPFALVVFATMASFVAQALISRRSSRRCRSSSLLPTCRAAWRSSARSAA